MIKAILFDLDGTLLPADGDVFTTKYFDALAKHHARHGCDPKLTVDCVWKGTVAMLKNKGEDTNENVFWRVFEAEFGKNKAEIKPLFDEFYKTDFDQTKETCGYTDKSNAAVKAAKAHGVPVVLATNPLFPIEAQVKRVMWAGVDPSDFEFITSYENSRYCKPRLEYYIDIADKLGVRPKECLMIGNDTSDDMTAAKIGMKVFLITDFLINKSEIDISAFPHGDAGKLVEFLKALKL
ncbi:MAG: HAD family hydrolase [Clostridiales bacterium]|nr:HAD family hydrolase [Clostridiales bacterium]